MGKIFFAFSSEAINQELKRHVIADSFECWNLKKMEFPEFLSELKNEIPPVNENITEADYINGFGNRRDDARPIMPSLYEKCSWGLLLPTSGDSWFGLEDQNLFIVNLFSPEFLHPIFSGSEVGIRDLRNQLPRYWMMGMSGSQNQSDKFKNTNFPKFYNELLDLVRLFRHSTDDLDKWVNEQSLIGMACFLFDDLKKYFSKNPYTYHREYLDMCVILETLLLDSNEHYNSTKKAANRAHLLVGGKFPDAKSTFIEIYNERNKFAHGKTFKEIKRYSMNNVYSPSTIAYNDRHFRLAEKAQKYVRHLLVAYLFLFKKKRLIKQLGRAKNLKLIKKATGNLYLRKLNKKLKEKPDASVRKAVKSISNEILSLMP